MTMPHAAMIHVRRDPLDTCVSCVTWKRFGANGDGYGCVAVNAWTGVGFLLAETTWGAFPGHTLDDVRSGIGVVHNRFFFDRAQKSVVYAPFTRGR